MTTPSATEKTQKGVPALESPLLSQLGFRHAFFTRQGGVSSGVFESLNFAANTGDTQENVLENLARVAAHLGVQPEHVYYLSQVHGTDHIVAETSRSQADIWKTQGDIVLAKETNVAAAIRTADCVPVLFACRKTGWVAACHSGWMGCVRGASMSAVEALRAQGATDLVAAIGPHISLAAFEVDEDVAAKLVAASYDKDIVDRSRAKPHVDLRRMVRSQLRSSGLADSDIDDVLGCTVLEPARFFSYRRDKNPSGRLLSAILPQ